VGPIRIVLNSGETIEGYGYGGWFGSNLKGNERCMHEWVKISEDKDQCMYCFTEQEREKKTN